MGFNKKSRARTHRTGTGQPHKQRVASVVEFLISIRAAALRGDPDAVEKYREIRKQIDKLSDPDTPWEERQRILGDMEKDGWHKAEDWPQRKRDWKFKGKEWQIPMSSEQLEHLETLKNPKWGAFLGDIVHTWLEAHPELKVRILEDIESLYFVTVWIACRMWGRDPGFSSWLTDAIVRKATRPIRVPADSIERTIYFPEKPHDPREALLSGGFIHLSELIAARVYYVYGRLDAYWRTAVRNYLKRHLGIGKRRPRSQASIEQPSEGSRQEWHGLDRTHLRQLRPGQAPEDEPSSKAEAGDEPTSLVGIVGDFSSLRTSAPPTDEIEDTTGLQAYSRAEAETFAQELKERLSPHGQRILVELHEASIQGKTLTNPEIAGILHIPLRTVERERQKIKKASLELMGGNR